jgi:hydantoinase/carbamoylase family amidase
VSGFDPTELGARAEKMIDALASISSEEGRLTRLYLTPEHRRAADLVAEWMRAAGLTVRRDSAATIHGFRPSAREDQPAARRLLVGSHIDSVIDAGKYDGTVGVIAGILAAEEIRARSIDLPFGLEILAFGDEEGVRFPKTLIGSSTVAGTIEDFVLDITDRSGQTIRNALLRFGCDPAVLKSEGLHRADVIGFLEVHIEQGPLLERWNEPLGVVTAIAAQSRHRVRIAGEAGHAGTVPMALRHDAVAGAAEFIAMVEEVARKGAKDSLVATVGEISAVPGAVNVIAKEAHLSLDVRASSDQARADAIETIRGRARQIGARPGVIIGIETVHEKSVAVCAPRLRKVLSTAIGDVTGQKAPELMSGAGHDGLAMAHLTDIGMIFVRCRGGISHSPFEQVTTADLGYAVEALVRAIVEIAREETA